MVEPYRVGVIGAGRVGAVLAAALRDAGHTLVAASGQSPASRTRIETLLPEAVVADPHAVAQRADLLLLTVPDDDLSAVVADSWLPASSGPTTWSCTPAAATASRRCPRRRRSGPGRSRCTRR
jgi:predicted short-subunit dehydrogenase-like oxidoreductase (DUF2520 family)